MDKDVMDIFNDYLKTMDKKLNTAKTYAHAFIAVDVMTYENFRDLCVKMLEEMKKNDSEGSVSKLPK